MAIRLAGDFDTSYAHDMAIVRNRGQWVMTIAFMFALFAAPFFLGGDVIGLLNLIGISIIAVIGLNILLGYTGQISLGQAAFLCVGSYTAAVLVKAGISFWFALPISGLTAGLVGLLFGIPSLRIKGFYLAMATLSAQMIIPWFFRNVRTDIFGGMPGLKLPPPELAGIVFNTQEELYFPIMLTVVVCVITAKNIARTRLGRALLAIRDNDLAAELLGKLQDDIAGITAVTQRIYDRLTQTNSRITCRFENIIAPHFKKGQRGQDQIGVYRAFIKHRTGADN